MSDGRTTRHPDYFGEKNPNAKLNWHEVNLIRKLYSDGLTPIKLSRLFKTSPSNISNIVAGRTWSSDHSEAQAAR